MAKLLELDREIFIFLNSIHSPFFDQLMYLLTETYVWIPLYLALIIVLIRKYKKNSIWILLGAILTIILADQITTSIMKPFFARLRPSHEPGLQQLIHLVNGYKGGLYGFASSHAANTFGIATFVWLALKPFMRWSGLIFIWAVVMTYTRIYLGVHYPGDILVGGLIGMFVGWTCFKLSTYLIFRNSKNKAHAL